MENKNRYEKPHMVPMDNNKGELLEEDLSRVTGGETAEACGTGDYAGGQCNLGRSPSAACWTGYAATKGNCAEGGEAGGDCMGGDSATH